VEPLAGACPAKAGAPGLKGLGSGPASGLWPAAPLAKRWRAVLRISARWLARPELCVRENAWGSLAMPAPSRTRLVPIGGAGDPEGCRHRRILTTGRPAGMGNCATVFMVKRRGGLNGSCVLEGTLLESPR